jgi:hypothetical protein
MVECLKSCAFFHASSLIGLLNHRLKACTTHNLDGLKLEEIFNEFRKVNETMKLNLKVFAAQTFAYQLSLFVQITCDVSLMSVTNCNKVKNIKRVKAEMKD